MSTQKPITISKKQVSELEKGDYHGLIFQMLGLGALLANTSSGFIENLKGPYKSDDGSLLFIATVGEIKDRSQFFNDYENISIPTMGSLLHGILALNYQPWRITMSEMPETTGCVLKRLIMAGMNKWNMKKVYSECINALDIDHYSPPEVKAMFNKLLGEHQAIHDPIERYKEIGHAVYAL